MLAFCLLFPVAVRFYEETYQEPFGRELERYVPGAHARWNDLVAALSG